MLTLFSCFIVLWIHTCRPIKTLVLSKSFYNINCEFSLYLDKPTLVTVSPYPEVTKEENESVTLNCQADGVPPPSYSWEFNNQVITGEVGRNLLRNNLQKSNIGNYSCVATNEIGVTKNYTKVLVKCKWSIDYY